MRDAQARDHPRERDRLPQPGGCVQPAQHPHDLLRCAPAPRYRIPGPRLQPHRSCGAAFRAPLSSAFLSLLGLLSLSSAAFPASSSQPPPASWVGATLALPCSQLQPHHHPPRASGPPATPPCPGTLRPIRSVRAIVSGSRSRSQARAASSTTTITSLSTAARASWRATRPTSRAPTTRTARWIGVGTMRPNPHRAKATPCVHPRACTHDPCTRDTRSGLRHHPFILNRQPCVRRPLWRI